MTILQRPPHSGDGHAATGRYKFGYADHAVRHTDAWEHETFAEEQARWERADPEYARICDRVRQANEEGGEASLRADEAKAEWDARVATQRHADDEAQRASHAHHHMDTTFAIASNDSPAPGIMPAPVRARDQSAMLTRTGEREVARAIELSSSPGQRNPVSRVLGKLMSVIRGDKYMVGAYPAWPDSATHDGDRLVRSSHHVALRAGELEAKEH